MTIARRPYITLCWDEQPPFWRPIKRIKWRMRHHNIARLEYELEICRMPLLGDFPWMVKKR